MDKSEILAVISKIRKNVPNTKIGFTCSAFDLLHSGHYLMLENCKANCDVLIIGLQTDPTLNEEYRVKTGGKNKNKPVQSQAERLIQIKGCRYVDYVVMYSTEEELYDLLKSMNIDIRFIGEDWKGKKYTGHDLPTQIHFNPRNHSYSTTDLRKRVYEAEKHKQYIN